MKSSSEGRDVAGPSVRRRVRGLRTIRPDVLEEASFVSFVLAADAFALGIAPVLGLVALVSFLVFVLLEEHLSRR